MIVFDLVCHCGCQFEGWFKGHDDYQKQIASGLILCPQCGGQNIRKILSPVAVHTGPPSDSADTKTSPPSEFDGIVSFLRELQAYVEKNFDDVGAELAKKSLRMHYGLEESRNIRGVASPEEEKILEGEGITLLKIPILSRPDKDKAN